MDYSSDYDRVLKYMMSDGEALRVAVAKQPKESLPQLAYADYLEEHGEPELAAVIRKHDEHFRKGPETYTEPFRKLSPEDAEAGKFVVQFPTKHSVSLLSPKNDKGTDHHFHWYGRGFSPEEMEQLHKGLVEKGHKIVPKAPSWVAHDAEVPEEVKDRVALNTALDHLDYLDTSGHRGHLGETHPLRDGRTFGVKRVIAADMLREAGRHDAADLVESHHPIDVADTSEGNREVLADYPSHTEHGGYPLMYLHPGGVLCADCAAVAAEQYPFDTDTHSKNAHVHWEGPPEPCQNCNHEIESAYGDPHAEEHHEE